MIAKLRPADARGFTATVLAVPLILALLSGIQLEVHQRETQFLVLPPLAVIIYLIFRDPAGPSTNFRSIVILPCVGSIVGQISATFLGLTPLGAAAALFVVLMAQTVMRANMPPALALALLAMFLRVHGVTYVLGVVQGTLVIFVIFYVWRRLSRTNQPWRSDTSR
jgi:CBS-domain-containing membrane protein